ncbi:hypothetical protein [Brevibacterium renqingii]|uniref:hypothetical protein n=1 Tax=Brevibacterium renqingii TaxID=2776916 RepID=UPI001ADED7D1|nr:hypothetical protein [Brevibacterium renqingii]
MSRKPTLKVIPTTIHGTPALQICRGYLATMRVRMDEATDLANAIIDLVEQEEQP